VTRNVTPAEIREGVRATFTRVAETPTASFRFPVGATLARQIGYPEDVLTSVPPSATEVFTGLAYLHPHLDPQPGEHVLDLGSGGGLDSILAARAVAPNGSVKGLDLSAAMVARAQALAATLGLKNAGFIEGSAEAMPFSDGAFDAALVNGFFNLCPDKAAVAAELSRVLKPGGRAAVAEITFTDPLPPTEVRTIDDWFR
jgi:arsenite methyltransferase